MSRRESLPTYHSDSFQVHFCPPQLFPVVMLVAFPLRDPAEFSRQLKDVLHQRTPANFIHGDLMTRQKTQSWVSHSHRSGFHLDLRFWQYLRFKANRKKMLTFPDLWISGMFWTQNLKPLTIGFTLGVVHVTEESGCSVRKKKNWSRLRWIYHRTFVNQSCSSSSHPSILVGYIEPKEVWLSYCRDT